MKEYVRSRGYTWSSGARIPIDLSFLGAALSKYRSPVVESLTLRAYGSVTAASTSIENFDHAAFVASNFLWRDKRGERINLSGREIRIAAQMEMGNNFVDPADQASSTNASFSVELPITFKPRRARRRADFRPGVVEFTSGEVIWTAAATNPISASTTINSLTLELHACISDEVVPEASSRMVWLGQNAGQSEDYYGVNGSLRYAYAYAYNSGSDLSSLAAYTEIDSTTLDMVDVQSQILKQQYQMESPSLDATNDEVTRNRVIPLVWPEQGAKSTEFRDVEKLHLRLQTALPTGGRFVYCAITDRDPVLTAAVLGVPAADVGGIAKKLSTPKGSKSAGSVPLAAAKRMPIRLR